MPHSFSQTTSLACPRCGTHFRAELWLIVDAAARPDLLARAKQGRLHEIACPNCGPVAQADAPLLLYFPPLPPGEGPGRRAEPAEAVRVLFSPAQATSAEEDQEHARALLARLRESLGPSWREEWLAQGLPAVPRPLLPLALTQGLEAVLKKMAEQAQQEIERLRENDPKTYQKLEEAARQMVQAAQLLQAIQEFIEANTWADSQRILEQRPELLNDQTDALLGKLFQAARNQGNENTARLFEEYRALLRRCREVGIPRAFAEKQLPPEALAAAEAAGLTPEQALEMARQAAQLPPELREALEELARRGVEIRSPEDLQRLLDSRPDLLEKRKRKS